MHDINRDATRQNAQIFPVIGPLVDPRNVSKRAATGGSYSETALVSDAQLFPDPGCGNCAESSPEYGRLRASDRTWDLFHAIFDDHVLLIFKVHRPEAPKTL